LPSGAPPDAVEKLFQQRGYGSGAWFIAAEMLADENWGNGQRASAFDLGARRNSLV
jgi:hypothetical protein